MRTNLSGFRNFIEEMDPSITKHLDDGESQAPGTDKGDFIQAGLGGELGLEWPDIVSTLEADPWFASHFELGMGSSERLYKDGTWKIVKGTLTPNGADIVLVKPGRSYLRPEDPNRRMDKTGSVDNRRYHLNRKELLNFLNKGWTPALQQAAGGGGGGGGMPGMM